MRRAGFTLFEVLAVVLVFGLVSAVAIQSYVDLSRATTRATDHSRDIRRGTAILDRVARDLEGAFLLQKPAEVDPLEHPWFFLAEGYHAEEGADHLKFITRSHEPRRSAAAEADYALVSYTAEPSENGALELRRWSTPRLPEGLDRRFPAPGSPDGVLLADDLAAFELLFLDEQGEWRSDWDSSTLTESSELPIAVEIAVALVEPEGDGDDLDEPPAYRRRVLLPVRPLETAVLFDREAYASALAEGDEEGDGESSVNCSELTVEECFRFSAAYARRHDGRYTWPKLAEYAQQFEGVRGNEWCSYYDAIPLDMRFLVRKQCR